MATEVHSGQRIQPGGSRSILQNALLRSASRHGTSQEWMEQTYRTFAVGLLGRYPALRQSGLEPHLMSYARDFTTPLSLAEQKQTLSRPSCLGSGALQAEDLLCVPLGCSTPILLRKQGDGYTFIGDIYVDGHMDGKAIDDCRNGTRKVEAFAIQ
ncbi:hypothetical protein DL98DRAFT_598098 [Cadophora sp. DSE1049]|nr:hypothetical protein DL98DRAFT_598098 [Cadophora sp. DSE1049]